MFVGFFSLLLFTGGNASDSELQTFYNGGNASDSELQTFYNDTPMVNVTLGLMPVSIDMEYAKPEDFPLIFEEIRANEMKISESCSFEAVLKHLNLTTKNDMYSLSRPVKHHRHRTWVLLEMKIYAILDVRETDQTLISYIWIYLRWDNEHIWWYPDDFCEIDHILVPANLLWMPDLTIEEMTKQDKASLAPYVNIRSHGWVEYRNDQVMTSTCKMHVYKFPFDMQSCNISFKSIMYSDKEIKLFSNKNNTEITELSRETIQTQYEWLFVSMTVTNKTVNHFGFDQTMIVYTINMKRRSVLYIANFLLPILFFLCLDLASLLMSDSGGEKVGFKVTVLLAVTVMQLILNEILPCSSDRIPLIAVYCIGIFTLMMLSLLETILVMYLMEKDSALNENRINKRSIFHCCFTGTEEWSDCTSVSVGSDNQTLSMSKESNKQLTEISLTMEKVSEELGEIKKAVALLGDRKEEEKPGYWTRVAKKINKFFAFFYVTSVVLFLVIIFSVWFLV